MRLRSHLIALVCAALVPFLGFAAFVSRENARLAHLVDDLLDVARITSGKIALDPVWANVDGTRSEQIVGNLVGNALRFTPAGGEIEVALRAADGLAVLRVRDSGIGIAPEMLPRVFDLFVQGERSADRGSGGLGLGLTLVRRIAELHGGSVEAESDGQGRGSELTVRVPAMAPPTGPGAKSHADGDGAARRILVVEDNADAREMLRIVLELAGHEVHEAVDGPSGLATAVDLRPDIALVDIGLPGFDGLEIARRVRIAVGASIYLVALTGYGQPDDRRLALEAGFDAHLVKPVDPPALLAAIRAVFSAAREA